MQICIICEESKIDAYIMTSQNVRAGSRAVCLNCAYNIAVRLQVKVSQQHEQLQKQLPRNGSELPRNSIDTLGCQAVMFEKNQTVICCKPAAAGFINCEDHIKGNG